MRVHVRVYALPHTYGRIGLTVSIVGVAVIVGLDALLIFSPSSRSRAAAGDGRRIEVAAGPAGILKVERTFNYIARLSVV
jgi:hypothetical protein